MKKLIEALHVIQDECKKHIRNDYIIECKDCPLGSENSVCRIMDIEPYDWKINDEIQKALL